MTTLKEIKGKHYLECEAIMLPTSKADNALIKTNIGLGILNYFKNEYFTQEYLKYINRSSYHLYIISLEEIKIGDWFYDTRDRIISNKPLQQTLFSKKIIATTDKSLNLPKPSVDFINIFIDAHNSQQPITKVLVEIRENLSDGWIPTYNNPDNCNLEKSAEPNGTFSIKVNSSNEISIKKVKDTWTKEELKPILLQLTKDVVEYMNKSNDSKTHFLIDTWINNNL